MNFYLFLFRKEENPYMEFLNVAEHITKIANNVEKNRKMKDAV